MDKAKAAVSSFMHRSGHHDTTVTETVAPAVQKETVMEQRREEIQAVKDREVHQDHYHTSVQPVKDREVLATQHHENIVGTEHRTVDHRNHNDIQHNLKNTAAQFQNESVRAPAAHTERAALPEVTGEHIHHHVHETVQPVIHKQTIEPHVTHTVVPVHEKVYNAPQHHTASTLPPVDISSFKQHGGTLTGRAETHDQFAGQPKNIDRTLGGVAGGVHSGTSGHSSSDHLAAGKHTGTHDHDTTGKHGKPSLMDKLNPTKDADGDGKKGFMK